MTLTYDFDRSIQISLQRDEAIVLLWYLSRELPRQEPGGLQPTFKHQAEMHSLEATLQELIHQLIDTGGPDADQIHAAALAHVLARFQ